MYLRSAAVVGADAAPRVTLLPYLSLREPVRFDGYWLGALEDFDGPWSSPELRAAASKLAALFVDSLGEPVQRPSLLAREGYGVDGSVPNPAGRRALIAAIGFAVVDANPYWSDDSKGHGWKVSTFDNADIWFQPVDLQSGAIALELGSRLRTRVGGRTLDGPPIPPPIELSFGIGGLKLDQELLDALHRVLSGSAVCADRERLLTAIRWHLKSWSNSASITDEDRVIYLKVALEVMSGTHKSTEAARRLNLLFGSVMEQTGAPIGIDDLLWSPWEPSLTRTWGASHQTEQRQLFEHWFMAFADARNEIVHDGRVAHLDYDEQASPYTGPLVEIGDRVTREAVKVLLGRCGYPAVWRSKLSRASMRAASELRMLLEDDG